MYVRSVRRNNDSTAEEVPSLAEESRSAGGDQTRKNQKYHNGPRNRNDIIPEDQDRRGISMFLTFLFD